jgi:hypothetical protein
MAIENLSKQSQENIANLLDRIRDKKCCAFIGAGLSTRAGYPSWSKLLNILKTESEEFSGTKINDENLDNYLRAEQYQNILGIDAFRNVIRREFDPNNDRQPWLPVHLRLVEMPFVSYVTTNYDCVIENAYKEKGYKPIYNYYPLLPITQILNREIYHIHGIIDPMRLAETQNSIILTRSDFDEAYKSDSKLIQLIKCLYSELTILFLGFNIKDTFMMRILKSSLLEFETTREIASIRGVGTLKNIKHYALLPYHNKEQIIDPIRRRKISKEMYEEIDEESSNLEDEELRSLGVQTVRYKSGGENHTPLINILHDLYLDATRISEPIMSPDLTFRGERQ